MKIKAKLVVFIIFVNHLRKTHPNPTKASLYVLYAD